jgi:hypothetical protein
VASAADMEEQQATTDLQDLVYLQVFGSAVHIYWVVTRIRHNMGGYRFYTP